jgi:hypothetical protein
MLTFLAAAKSCALIQIYFASHQLATDYWLLKMEPTTGIEPVNLILTKDVLYQLSYVGPFYKKYKKLERETGLEPATLSLEG